MQQTAAQSSLDSLRHMLEQAPVQEKVYIHMDNTCYFKGDTIWYKAYVVRADNNHYTDMSRGVTRRARRGAAAAHRLGEGLQQRGLRTEGLPLLRLLRASRLHPLDAQLLRHGASLRTKRP